MENIKDVENKNYQSAERRIHGVVKYFAYFFTMFRLVMKVTGVALKEIAVSLFWPVKVKCIRGQLALVTGGANGLGQAIAFELAAEGCHVIIVDINETEAVQTAVKICGKFNVKVKAYKVDVSDFLAIQKLKADIDIDFSGQSVDILINNAGLLPVISLREGDYKDIQRIIDVNLISHFWMTRTFLDQMIEKKRGHIVGILSILAKLTIPSAVAYSTSKCGIDGFYRALFDDLCIGNYDEYIFATCIFPAFINTRRELTTRLEAMKGTGPLIAPEYVASEIVKAVRRNKRSLTVPGYTRLFSLARYLTPKATKLAKRYGAESN